MHSRVYLRTCRLVYFKSSHLVSYNSLLSQVLCECVTLPPLSSLLIAVVLDTPGGVVTEGSWALYSCTFPCTHSIVAWRVGEDLVIDNTRLALRGFDRRLQQSGITEASIQMISSCSDSTEAGTKRLRIRVTTQLDGIPIQCEALPRDPTLGSTNLYSLFRILQVQPQATTDGTIASSVSQHPSPTPATSSTCVCAPSYALLTTSSVNDGTAPSVPITPSPALCPSPTPGMWHKYSKQD